MTFDRILIPLDGSLIAERALPAARALLSELQMQFAPRPLAIGGLALNRYLGGPWERLGRWSFRGA